MSSTEIREAAIALYDRYTHEGLDRRTFMAGLTRIAGSTAAATALLAGIAADPVAAAIVPADDKRVRAREVAWPVADGREMRGYQASPATGLVRGALVVIHENRGLNDHIRDVARRAATAGYVALAPDFLTGQGGTPADQDAARKLIGGLDLGATVQDAVATLDWLRKGTGRRVGTVGFCWGGAMVNRVAVAAGGRLDAGVVFYGPGPSPAEAAKVSAPLLIHLAEKDERVNGTALPWVAALRSAGKQVRAINHHGVDHAFHNDTSTERYNAKAATRAWSETLAFFRKHLA
ncbi:MAG TPA: dienelactone hydrolase family protein [Allosphingosinicella sp.]|uniref:dienelactone hydrolase family protein n=1 Tax=Allosphingosinicella sp. TaxID=2823234 RepID=UPI002F2A2A4B